MKPWARWASRRLPALVLLTTLGLQTSPSISQPDAGLPLYAPATLAQWQGEFSAAVHENYNALFRPHLSAAEALRLRSLRFEFPLSPEAVIFAFHTRVDAAVVLPVASLMFLKDLAMAEAWLQIKGYSTLSLLDYMGMLRLGRLRGLAPDQRLPLAALGIPADAAADPRVLDRRNDTFSKLLLFIVGHELGHLLQPDGLAPQARCQLGLGCDWAAQRRAEQVADEIAIELMRRAGLVANPAALFFALDARRSASRAEFADPSRWQTALATMSHPLDSERIAHLGRAISSQRLSFAGTARDPAASLTRVDSLVQQLSALAQALDDAATALLQLAMAKTLEPADLQPRHGDVPTLRPGAADLSATAPWTGYHRGELRLAGAAAPQPLELLWRPATPVLNAQAMLGGIRGRITGALVAAHAARLVLDLGGDLYDMELQLVEGGRTLSGQLRSRTDPSLTGTLELRRAGALPRIKA